MLSEDRQERLKPVLEALRGIEGLEAIQDDDFNSTEIDVWMFMTGRRAADSRYWEFDQELRRVKAQIKSALNKVDTILGWRWVDYPMLKYEYVSVHDRRYGESSKRRLGYDQTRLGVAVVIPERTKAQEQQMTFI